MSVKALKRQFAASVAMVVVAAVALSSSTFAWFANNNKVSATGLNVQATAEGGIEIKVASGTQTVTTGDWASSADAAIAKTTLYPTSTLANAATNGKLTSAWYHASADAAGAYVATGETYAKLQTVSGKCTFTNGIESGNGVLAYADDVMGGVAAGAYYIATVYDIASVGKEATDLKVDGVTVSNVTSGQQGFDQSLRVAVVCGSNIAVYAPVGYTSNATYKVCTATTGTPMVLAGATMPGTNNMTALPATTTSDVIADTVGAVDEPTKVTVYVWYEGEDTNHYTDNLGTTPDGLAVTVNFVATI